MANYINQKMLDELTKDFKGAKACVFMSVQGMTAIELGTLRAGFGEWNVKFQVVKNQIAKRALDSHEIRGIENFLMGPTAIAYGDGESAVKAAKVVAETMKTSKVLTVKGAYFEGMMLTPDQVKELAKIPSKKELFSSILGGVVSLMSAAPSLVQASLSKPAYLASAYAEQKEKSAGAA